jgi:hypothetical protein
LGNGGGGGGGGGADSWFDVFSNGDGDEEVLDEFSSTGMVPYISKTQMKRALLLFLLVFLVTQAFFVAFEAGVVEFLIFVGGLRRLGGGCRQGFLMGRSAVVVSSI